MGIPEVRWLPPSLHLSPPSVGWQLGLIDLKLAFHLVCWSGTSSALHNPQSHPERWGNETDRRPETGRLPDRRAPKALQPRRRAAEGCRIKGSLSQPRQIRPPTHHLSPQPQQWAGWHWWALLHLLTPPCPPPPSPTPGSGSKDVWGDTMEVPLMYFLWLFPCTQEEQCVCACVCKW